MTSVDSGIETSNNSDDSSIAQNEDVETEEINNVSLALATITSNQNDICEIESETLRFEPGSNWSICWPYASLPISSISSLSLMNKNDRYPGDIENSIPTSSSGPSNVLGTLLSHLCSSNTFPANAVLTKKYDYRRKMKSIDTPRRSHHPVPVFVHTSFVERKMRIAAATNNTMMMRRLLSCGASPNNCDVQGRTPLHLASCRGYTEMVRLLLEHGANPNLRDCVGNTPLHLATVTSKISVVTLLLNAETDPLCLGQDGYNPLQLAQSKLRLLQNYNGEDMVKIEELQNIVSMLLAYLQKHKDTQKKMETLSTFCSRLSLSSTSDQVQDNVKDLLANLDALSITQ